MLDGMVGGLELLLSWDVILAMLFGLVFSQIVAVIPGLGGSFALAIILPFAVTMDFHAGIGLIIGTMVADGTGNSVTSILFNVPGSPSGLAATFDGYPLTKKGQGARALSASVTASMLGGVFGATVLAISLPFIRPAVLAFGPPEFFILAVLALFTIAYVNAGSFSRGLVSAALGVLTAMVGASPITGELRYTFGSLFLWSGFGIVPVVLGMFAISEMVVLARRGSSISVGAYKVMKSQRLQGMMDVVRRPGALLWSSSIGVLVGALPGLGASAAQFMGYGFVARRYKDKVDTPFGQGAYEGVIAADAPTNSKDGGAFIPTLLFGIPGSVSFALLLAVLLGLGVSPGRDMLETNLDLVWMMIYILLIGEIFSAGLILSLIPLFVKAAALPVAHLVPVILILSLIGSYTYTNHIGNAIGAAAFGVLGYLFLRYGYSRAVFVIAFVLAPIIERQGFLSYNIHGWGMFVQPITLGILATVLIGTTGSAILKRRKPAALASLVEDEVLPLVADEDPHEMSDRP